jgi:Transposase
MAYRQTATRQTSLTEHLRQSRDGRRRRASRTSQCFGLQVVLSEHRLDEAADPPLNVVASMECPTERTRAHGRKEKGPAMNHGGLDVHKHASQICMIAEGGELIEQRVRTDASRLAEALAGRVRAQILIEASTESEWVARCLERLGHEVIVADPNFAPMYATRQRKVKTDRRDARALAEACVLGAYRRAHRLSDAQRHVRGRLGVRDALVLSAVAPY